MTILRVQLYIVVFLVFCLIFVYQCLFGEIKIIINRLTYASWSDLLWDNRSIYWNATVIFCVFCRTL